MGFVLRLGLDGDSDFWQKRLPAIPVRDSVADDLPECVARKWKCASVTDVVMPSAVLADNDDLAE